jgi:UDP-N-acetylmuramyl pentapeptide phosphotransferase/UDP-N-acetylglucosamine-1-phosphate transferase
MEWLDLVQWPAMVVSIVAAWLVASQNETKREIGFWVFLLSNVLWIAWGWYDDAWALIGLNIFLAGMNIRGIVKNERARRSS